MKRRPDIDIAKAIGILTVLIGHIRFCFHGDVADLLARGVYAFNMPLFFMLSGLLLSTKSSLLIFVGNRARRLLIPYVVGAAMVYVVVLMRRGFSWTYTIGHLLSLVSGNGRFTNNSLLGDIQPIGAIWFLLALFSSVVLVRLAIHWKYGDLIVLVGGVGAFVWVAFGLPYLPLGFIQALAGAAYIVVGYRLLPLVEKYDALRYGMVALGVAGLVLVYVFQSNLLMSMAEGTFFSGLVAVPISCLVLSLSRLLDRVRFVRYPFVWIGAHTLSVLVAHHVYLSGALQMHLHKCLMKDGISGALSQIIEISMFLLFPFFVCLTYCGLVWGFKRLRMLREAAAE